MASHGPQAPKIKTKPSKLRKPRGRKRPSPQASRPKRSIQSETNNRINAVVENESLGERIHDQPSDGDDDPDSEVDDPDADVDDPGADVDDSGADVGSSAETEETDDFCGICNDDDFEGAMNLGICCDGCNRVFHKYASPAACCAKRACSCRCPHRHSQAFSSAQALP